MTWQKDVVRDEPWSPLGVHDRQRGAMKEPWGMLEVDQPGTDMGLEADRYRAKRVSDRHERGGRLVDGPEESWMGIGSWTKDA